MQHFRIEAKQGPDAALAGLLQSLLQAGKIDTVLGGFTSPSGARVDEELVASGDDLSSLASFAPTFFHNRATTVARLTRLGAPQTKVAVVLRPCETRALVELAKLKQIYLDNVVVVGIDCVGTYSAGDYRERRKKGEDPGEAAWKAAQAGESLAEARPVCQTCITPTAGEPCDLIVHTYGLDGEVLLEARSKEGQALVEGLNLEEAAKGEQEKYQQGLEKLSASRQEARQAFIEEMKEKFAGPEKILDAFDACQTCRNCSEVCPICYCKECYFKLLTLETDAERHILRAQGKGQISMPLDASMFHLGRILHMAQSCVSCGACEEACPAGVPVAGLFALASSDIQSSFDYLPGASLEEGRPLSTFREDEFPDEGER